MSYNEKLSDRIADILQSRKVKYTDKKMFGGLCYMVDDKMLIGVEKDRIMARIDPDDQPAAMKKKGAKPMDFTGRVMKGFVFVDDKAVDMDKELEYWVDLTLKYNPKAKASKKKSDSKKAEKTAAAPKSIKKSVAKPTAKTTSIKKNTTKKTVKKTARK